jgi:hypothetical protein
MAGRLMRPDKEGLKKYATIIECINLDDQKDKKGSKELVTVRKIMDYYQMILNMSSYDIGDMEYARIVDQFEQLYKNTFINKTENEIHINLTGQEDGKCIIKFEDTTIDWSLFERYLRTSINERLGISVQDDYKKIIEKIIKLKYKFNEQCDFNEVYNNITIDEFENINFADYDKKLLSDILKTKSWYDILEYKNNYYTFNEFIDKMKTSIRLIKYVDNWSSLPLKILNKFNSIDSMIPPNPIEFYRLDNC